MRARKDLDPFPGHAPSYKLKGEGKDVVMVTLKEHSRARNQTGIINMHVLCTKRNGCKPDVHLPFILTNPHL